MKPVTKTLSTFLVILYSTASHSQQWNNWYFGWNAGISFSTAPPQSPANGSLHTEEGCSAISNSSGNILFYTDGMTAWNRYHIPMPNGMGLVGMAYH